MARRHVDRKPGQRLVRSGSATNKKGPAKKVGGKKADSRKTPAGSSPSARTPISKSAMGRPAGKKSASATPLRKAPAKRAPLRGSKRLAEGLVVTPSKVLGGNEAATKDGKVRLNHYLAQAGICSRRNADDLIAGGRVQVNGEVVREHGVRVDPVDDEVYFDGTRLQPERAVYVLVNKPKGVVCTNAAHEQKKRVVDLLPTIRGRIFTVGRLDLDSEGLLLVTNDGAFAQEMTHPRYGISKLYSVTVRGRIESKDITKARGGVWLAEGPTGGMELKIERLAKEKTYLKVTLREGKNREIRRVFAQLGYPVTSLKRVRIGHLSLHGLKNGSWRFLTTDEVSKLRDLALEELAAGGASAPISANAFAENPTASRPSSSRPSVGRSRKPNAASVSRRPSSKGPARPTASRRPATSARKKIAKTTK